MEYHPVYFVSLGPGDAGLVTLKSLHVLQQADRIYCPATGAKTGKEVSRAAGLLRELKIDKEISTFLLPMDKDRRKAMEVYRRMFGEIRQEYRKGKRIAVAVEGDAGIYASIHYVLDALREDGIPVEQLPGIPSFIASGAAARLHLVSGQEKLVVIPGDITATELDAYLHTGHVLAVMKLSRCADVVRNYITHHPEYEYHYFENVSTEKEYHTCDTEELAEKEFPYFSLMVILNGQARKGNTPE